MPVKAFADAKARLAPVLAPPERAALARAMAETVLHAANGLPVTVVCDDAAVAAWAHGHGAAVVLAPGRGLNGAVEDGMRCLRAAGVSRAVVAHADLPLARDLAHVARFAGVTLVPDRREDGTNVMCVPTAASFRFSYGPGSFSRHLREATRLGLPVRVVRDPLLAWDVDGPADLDLPAVVTLGA